MNAPAQALLPAPGLPARAARHLRALLPTLDPAAALRLTFYLGGLLCFDGILSRQIRISLEIAAVCVFAACLSIVPALRRRLDAYSPVLLIVGVACLPLLVGAYFHVTNLRNNTLLIAGIVLFSVACLSTLPRWLYRLFPCSRVLLAVG